MFLCITKTFELFLVCRRCTIYILSPLIDTPPPWNRSPSWGGGLLLLYYSPHECRVSPCAENISWDTIPSLLFPDFTHLAHHSIEVCHEKFRLKTYMYISNGVASRDPHGDWFFTRWCLYYILGSIAAVKRGSFQKSSGTHRLVLCRVLLWFGLDKHQSRISRNRVTFLSLFARLIGWCLHYRHLQTKLLTLWTHTRNDGLHSWRYWQQTMSRFLALVKERCE